MAKPPDIFQDCPFPEVAESLRPYIKTRQEVTQIRQELQALLPLPVVRTAYSDVLDNVDPSALTGVRKAYWRALQAHRLAQSKYDSIKGELEQIVHHTSQPESPEEEPSAFLSESYLPLMRQREKYRKLRIIDKSAAKIHVAGGDTVTESFEKFVKRTVGELPAPPSTSAVSEREAGLILDHDLTRLKKAILSTTHQLDQHQDTALALKGTGVDAIDPHADLKGLQRAHSELTTWMETQLALISDVTAPKHDTVNGAVHPETNGTHTDSVEDIEVLYEHYLELRQRLLATVANPPSSSLDDNDALPDVGRRGTEISGGEVRATPAEILLPHLPDLLMTKQQEQYLLQQGLHTRRQLTSTESEVQAILTRLADESHLVEPDINRGLPHGRDWVRAADKASESTSSAVAQRVKHGLVSAETATNALEAIREMPRSFDALL